MEKEDFEWGIHTPRTDPPATSRKIVISGCGECPHRDHKGAFGHIGYIPTCGKMHRDLPFTTTTQECQGRKGHYTTTAVLTGVIPDWCPLEKD